MPDDISNSNNSTGVTDTCGSIVFLDFVVYAIRCDQVIDITGDDERYLADSPEGQKCDYSSSFTGN